KKPVLKPVADDADAVPEGSISRDALIYLLGCAHAMLLSKIRPALRSRHLDDDDYFVLNVLSTGAPRSLAEIDALMAYGGSNVDPDRIDALVRRALVHHGAHANGAAPRLATS